MQTQSPVCLHCSNNDLILLSGMRTRLERTRLGPEGQSKGHSWEGQGFPSAKGAWEQP